jgi:hypothetical protein
VKKKKGNFVSKIQEAAADYKRGQKEREEKAAKEEKGKKK